jgi:hypothetical protein
MKATNWRVSAKFLQYKTPKNPQFTKPKWIEFCEYFLDRPGVVIKLYEARKTNSKYITIHCNHKQFKVRFSDHKPIAARELQGDCDFFVGITNLATTNTKMAIVAVEQFLKTA